MLQQTQVGRVIPKYKEFLDKFPDAKALAKASLADVIKVWSGLGYNRRAKYLHDAAKVLMHKDGPWTLELLQSCKGVGFNTAAAAMVYAYNQPIAFVETNIRTVYIHHFFADKTDVKDTEILPLVEDTIDRENPREFYWALMDWGSYLKTSVGNFSRQSKHYVNQSKFEGSKRQIRGQVLRLLAEQPQTHMQLQTQLTDDRLPKVLEELRREGLVSTNHKHYLLTT